jgi:hypothetical protein
MKSIIIGEYRGVKVELHASCPRIAGKGFMFTLIHETHNRSYRSIEELINSQWGAVDNVVFAAMINNYIIYYC